MENHSPFRSTASDSRECGPNSIQPSALSRARGWGGKARWKPFFQNSDVSPAPEKQTELSDTQREKTCNHCSGICCWRGGEERGCVRVAACRRRVARQTTGGTNLNSPSQSLPSGNTVYRRYCRDHLTSSRSQAVVHRLDIVIVVPSEA